MRSKYNYRMVPLAEVKQEIFKNACSQFASDDKKECQSNNAPTVV